MGSGDLLHVPVRVGRGKIKMKSLGSIWKTSYMFYENETCNFKKNKYIYIYVSWFGNPSSYGFSRMFRVDCPPPNLEPLTNSSSAQRRQGVNRKLISGFFSPWVWWASWVPLVFSPQPQRVVGKIVPVIGLDAANKMWSNLEMLKKRGNKYPSPQKN